MAIGEVVFIDSIEHYTTVAQARTKYAWDIIAPAAGTGAFGTHGIETEPGDFNNQYNFAANAEREFSVYLNTQTPSNARNLWVLLDNTYAQIFADAQPDGSIKVWKGGVAGGGFGSTPARDTLLGTIPAGTLQYGVQNLHKVMVLHHGTTGTIDYELNGQNVLSLTGINTAPSGNNQSTILVIGYFNTVPGSPGATRSVISHLVISYGLGTIGGSPRTGALWPDGAGAHTDFTPFPAAPNWDNVNETPPNEDTDYNESANTGDTDTYTMQDTPADTTFVAAVAVTCRLEKTDASSHTVAAVLRIAGVDYVHPVAKGVAGTYAYLQWVWTFDPSAAAGTRFTKAVVDALEAGITIVT